MDVAYTPGEQYGRAWKWFELSGIGSDLNAVYVNRNTCRAGKNRHGAHTRRCASKKVCFGLDHSVRINNFRKYFLYS